ncbi:glycosyltransferase family 2 protein [Aminipila butyrica]|uniref:Glycosyltransferase family 2 protein n=1 Tax=Aminipila butyrica TaxID=433296 RepID=A0A858BTR5_9FIRM|nr:glycosyltransferase family 2 protein [Aminipila butyrica]QIB68164.1 glycosyltransferase family 2 protein [Aminipila butyrica]
MPKISVILPAYNHEKYIASTLQSLLNQTVRDIEVIVVDDGSTDRTGEIIDEYSAQDSRIKAYHKENGGVVSASNEAMRYATGEWLAWCGSDDIIPPNAYQDLLKKSKTVDVVIGEFSEITDSGEKVRVHMQKWRRKSCFDSLFAMPAMWSKIIRRELITANKLQFPDVKLCEDLIFLAKVAALRPKYSVIHKDIYHYRNNPKETSGSMTHTYSLELFKAHVAGRFRVLKICDNAGLENGRNYIFLDSIKYLSGYLPEMKQEDVEVAMGALKRLVYANDWTNNEKYFESVFGVKPAIFLRLSGEEYVYMLLHEDVFKKVLRKFEAGDIGLQFALQCVKAWWRFKSESKMRK